MIGRGRVVYLWDEDDKRRVYFLRHRTTSKEGCDCFNDVISHNRPKAFVESNRKAVGSRCLQVRHVE